MTDKKLANYTKKTIEGILRYITNNGGPGMANLNEITPNIYCSDYDIACNADLLNENRIYTVISLGDSKSKSVLNEYKKYNIKNIQYSIADDPNQNLADVFMETYDLILKTVGDGRKVLVHCNAGVSRAPSVIIAYIMRRQYLISYNKYMQELRKTDLIEENRYNKLTNLCRMDDSKLLAIIKFVKRVRACIAPNPGFIQQLFLFERYLKSQIAMVLSDIRKRDDDEVHKRKMREISRDSDNVEEYVIEAPKPKPEKNKGPLPDYVGKDSLIDLDSLEISDEEPTTLEKKEVKQDKILAVGDLDNSDIFDQLSELDNKDPLDTIDDKKEIEDDFDLDF